MSAKASQAQQDVGGVLKRIESDIHEFAGCIQRAEATVNNEDKERCHKELETLSARLQEHRSEIRRWSAPLDARAKGRLGAARGRIDQELRKFKVVEARLRPKATSKKGSDTIAPSKAADVSESVALQPVAKEEEAKANPGAVKVLIEQVMEGGSEKCDMREEFVCKICLVHLVGCRPKLTSCSHLFCGDCLEKWFAVQPGSQSWAQRACSAKTVPCPVCKEKLHEERDLYTVGPGGRGGSLLLWQMLSGVPIVCANHPKVSPKGRCDWRGDYGSYEEHIRSCQNAPIFSAATTPTVTPDFTPAACCLDEDLARLRLDSASSEDGFVSEYEELPRSSSTTSETSPEPKAAQQPREAPVELPEAREPSGQQEDLVQKPQSSTELESGHQAAPTPPAAHSAEAEVGDKASAAEQDDQEVAAQASQTSAAPEAASMSDLTSLIGALYELKVRERLRLQQTAGAGAPAQAPAGGAAAAEPSGSAAEAAQAVEAEAAAVAKPEPPAEKKQAAGPEAPKAELKEKKKQQQTPAPQQPPQEQEAAAPTAAAKLAPPHAQMQSAQAARAARIQAAEWQMAQAAWWQQQQLWQAAQWQAAYSASLGQQPSRR